MPLDREQVPQSAVAPSHDHLPGGDGGVSSAQPDAGRQDRRGPCCLGLLLAHEEEQEERGCLRPGSFTIHSVIQLMANCVG